MNYKITTLCKWTGNNTQNRKETSKCGCIVTDKRIIGKIIYKDRCLTIVEKELEKKIKMEEKEYNEIIEYLQGKNKTANAWILYDIKRKVEKFEIQHEHLYKRKKNGDLLQIIRKEEKESILYMMYNHATGGHFGIDSTYGKSKNGFIGKECIKT